MARLANSAPAAPREAPGPGCVIVLAHPDDEALWTSSLLQTAGKIILCFNDIVEKPAFSARRRQAVAALPLADRLEALGVAEASAFNLAAWPEPQELAHGLRLRPLPFGIEGPIARAYLRNFAALQSRLRGHLAPGMDVVTHNPWGEYGHEEHVQVFRAVESLRREIGFRLWVTCHAGAKAGPLMRRHLHRLGPASPPLPTDTAMAARLRDIYAAHRCWTWHTDHAWPAQEWFFPVLPQHSADMPRHSPVRPARVISVRSDLRSAGPLRAQAASLLRNLRFGLLRRLPAIAAWLEARRKQ